MFASPASRVTVRGAQFSACFRYRYCLTREWPYGDRTINFLMLNPSTADDKRDDPTIRRCIGFAMAWGYRRLLITNLFALRSTSPRSLYDVPDPIGPENDAAIREAAAVSDRVVCAWGLHGEFRNRGVLVLDMLEAEGRDRVWCLGKTKTSFPKHPLYLPGNSALERWWP